MKEASREREKEWSRWMRAAVAGDSVAYQKFLVAVTPRLRSMARRRCEQVGAPTSDAEDIVQEALLAIHLKRATWDQERPIGPWISTIVRNKLIDSLRRRGRQTMVPIEDVIETLESPAEEESIGQRDLERLLNGLPEQQSAVVRSISLAGLSARETAGRLGMTEISVRVTLHRALKKLAALYRGGSGGDERDET